MQRGEQTCIKGIKLASTQSVEAQTVDVQDATLTVPEVMGDVSVCVVASGSSDLPMRVRAKTASGTATEHEDFHAYKGLRKIRCIDRSHNRREDASPRRV